MASTYFTLLTKAGQAQIANAVATGQSVEWTAMAVGDGNGNPTTPNENQTALVRERYRAQINQLTVDPDNPNYMIAELVIPTDVGGWVVYEVGVFNSDGDMVAVANFPATYKPQISEGSGRDLVVRVVILVSNSSTVTLKIDPAIVLASQKWVDDNYLRRSKVAGGTTGQVLAKTDNGNENFQWVDPTAAVQVIVDAKTERQTLATSQTVVTLQTLTTQALAVYVEGVRLIETLDYTKTDATHITLARSYPAGYRIHMYQNDPTSTIADATETQRGFATLATSAEATSGTNDAHVMTPLKTYQATPGRLLRRLVYTLNGGVQQVSVNGGAFTAAGATVYAPDPLMRGAYVKGVGGGGAGGGASNPTSGNVSLGAPGMCGAYGEAYFTKAQIGASVAVTIGVGGNAAAGSTGATGGTTALGSLFSCPGGTGGSAFNNTLPPVFNGNGGTTSLPIGANIIGMPGISQLPSIAMSAGALQSMLGGAGGRSAMGVGSSYNAPNANGLGGQGFGDGGSGIVLTAGGGTGTGGVGNRGILIIEEYA